MLQDWENLSPDLHRQLIDFLPLEAKGVLSSLDQASVHGLHGVYSRLDHLCNVFRAMVPRWVADSVDNPDTKRVRASEATLLFADVTGFTPLTTQGELSNIVK